LVGTIVSVTGVVMRTSNDEFWEMIGVTVHRVGLFILLLGFVGIFVLIQRSLEQRYSRAFQWEFNDGVLEVVPSTPTDIVKLELDNLSSAESLEQERERWNKARMLSLQDGRLSEPKITALVAAKRLVVLELDHVVVEANAWDAFDAFYQLELLVLPESTSQADIVRLQSGLPEVKILKHPLEIKPVDVFVRPA
jgi:hypothetical protein